MQLVMRPNYFISKETTLTVAEAQGLIQQPEVVPNSVTVQGTTQGNRGRLPSCYVCYAFDHVASVCPGTQ